MAHDNDAILGDPIRDEDAQITYWPWIGPNGEVGYYWQRAGGAEGYIYLNASGGSDDGVPTVFVYQGTEGNPATDQPQHYYTIPS